jgi:hypothetical protein
MSKPIRVRERHVFNPETQEPEPTYDVYVRGQSYLTGVPYFDLNKWIGHAITHVRGTTPLTGPQRCE